MQLIARGFRWLFVKFTFCGLSGGRTLKIRFKPEEFGPSARLGALAKPHFLDIYCGDGWPAFGTIEHEARHLRFKCIPREEMPSLDPAIEIFKRGDNYNYYASKKDYPIDEEAVIQLAEYPIYDNALPAPLRRFVRRIRRRPFLWFLIPFGILALFIALAFVIYGAAVFVL